MTTAEQLLASVFEPDRTFIIDNDLRTIGIPSNISNLGVQSDDDVMTVHFQMPGTYCDIDLSQFNIRINYLNAAGEGDYHDVDDAEVQTDGTIKFSWTVGRHAAAVVGNVEFNVCMKLTDSSGKVLKEFNTTTATLPILKGLEVSEQVISEYNDILEQWRAKLFGIGDTEEGKILAASEEQQQAITNKGESILNEIELKGSETLATIPGTYTEVYQMADEALRTKADAIVLEAEGTVISVNDSSDDHLLNLKMFGRTTQITTNGYQLLNANRINTNTMNGVTLTNNGNGNFTIGGQTTLTDTFAKYYEYTHEETVELLHAGPIKVSTERTTNPYVYAQMVVNSAVVGTISNYKNKAEEIDILQEWLDNETSFLRIGFFGKTDVNTSVGVSIRPMIYQDGDGTWEPYTGGKSSPNPEYPQEIVSVENSIVRIYGKNLLDISAGLNECLVDNGDDTYTITKVAENKRFSTNIPMPIPASTKFRFSFKTVEKTCAQPIQAQVIFDDGTTTTLDQGREMMYNKPIVSIRFYISVADSVGTHGVIKDCQIEVGTEATDYEPYKPIQNLTLTHTLHGIPVTSGGNYTDENGLEWICDEVDFNRGVYVQRILDYNFTGNENWWLHESGRFYSVIGDMLGYKFKSQCAMCSHVAMSKSSNPGYYGLNGTNGFYFNKNDLFTTVDDLTEFLKNNTVKVAIALDEPIETPLTAEELMAYRALKTNRTNTTIVNDHNAPMAIAYSADTLTFLRDNQPKPTDEQVKTAVDEYIDENGLAKTTATIVNNILVIK